MVVHEEWNSAAMEHRCKRFLGASTCYVLCLMPYALCLMPYALCLCVVLHRFGAGGPLAAAARTRRQCRLWRRLSEQRGSSTFLLHSHRRGSGGQVQPHTHTQCAQRAVVSPTRRAAGVGERDSLSLGAHVCDIEPL